MRQRPWATRRLQEANAGAASPGAVAFAPDAAAPAAALDSSVTVIVESEDELRDAVARMAQHIEIRAHLDLRTSGSARRTRLNPPSVSIPSGEPPPMLGVLPDSVRSIRGICTMPPPEEMRPGRDEHDLLPLRARQCLLLLDSGLLMTDHRLWLDGLYLRITAREHAEISAVQINRPRADNAALSKLWLSDVIIQGDASTMQPAGRGLVWGVSGDQASILAQRCMFSHLGGLGTVAPVGLADSQASFQNCGFRDNYVGTAHTGVVWALDGTNIILENTTFSGNIGQGKQLAAAAADDEGFALRPSRFFSDDPDLRYCIPNEESISTSAVAEATVSFDEMLEWLDRMQADLGVTERPLLPGQPPLVDEPNAFGDCTAKSDYEDDPDVPLGALPAAALVEPAQADAPRQILPTLPAPAPTPAARRRPPPAAPQPRELPQPPPEPLPPTGRVPIVPPLHSGMMAPGGQEAPPAGGGGMMDGMVDRTTAIVLVAGAMFLAALTLITLLVYFVRRRRAASKDKHKTVSVARALMVEESGELTTVSSRLHNNISPASSAISAHPRHIYGQPQHSATLPPNGPSVPSAANGQASTQSMAQGARAGAGGSVAARSQHGAAPGSPHSMAHSMAQSRSMQSLTAQMLVAESGSWPSYAHEPGRGSQIYMHVPAPGSAGSYVGSNRGTQPMYMHAVAPGLNGSRMTGQPVDMHAPAPGSGTGGLRGTGQTVYMHAGAPASGSSHGILLPRLESASSTARMRALLHPPTELGTLAESDAWKTVSQGYAPPPQDPNKAASVKEQLNFIGRQLDSFGPRGVILQRYELLDEPRRRGGQAVVQFVRCRQTSQTYAIKLFASRKVFEDEKCLYEDWFSVAICCRPTVLEFIGNEDGSFRDPLQRPMPPCFIMEKGESLVERTLRIQNDLFTKVSIIGQVAKCLSTLHSLGWAHRDLKPGNIIFLPRTGTWTLIDFGLAARTGGPASIAFTLTYAPPEVARLYHEGAPTLTADPATDAWALGVIAFELLTGRPAFDMLSGGMQEVQRQLRGDAELPWEGSRFTPEVRKQLGAFKTPILAMLTRDPARRSSCRQLAEALQSVFLTPTTTTTTMTPPPRRSYDLQA
eukprot:jgi/Ulvmu1/9719/UM055_0057.1